MDEVKDLITHYKTMKNKIEFVKSYYECINILTKKSSNILMRATQIPRDTEWNDPNLLNLVELSEKQRELYERSNNSYLEMFKELDELILCINEEILLIETNLSKLLQHDEQKNRELDVAKKAHFDSWMTNKDPWLTDIRLKVAIKNMYNNKESSTFVISNMKSMYKDKYLNIQDLYIQTLNRLCKEQKRLYRDLTDVSNLKFNTKRENDRYSDALGYSKELNSSKIIDTYETIIQNMSNKLTKKNINIWKNIEPVKSGVYKIKRGLTGDWILCFVSVTKSRFVHFFQISNIGKISEKYSELLAKLKNSGNKSILSIFENRKSFLKNNDEKKLGLLTDEILENIDKFIDNIFLTINLSNKILNIEKDSNLITISEKSQSGFSNLFGINIIKIKGLTLGSCYELFFALNKSEELVINDENEKEEFYSPIEEVKNIVVKIKEENPWTD